jgi:hypothetical protein
MSVGESDYDSGGAPYGRLLSSFPAWVRRPIEVLFLLSAISGALVSVFGLFSFMARLIWWHDLWEAFNVLAQNFPHALLMTIRWMGSITHQFVVAYRETVYPIVSRITRVLPFKIPPWAIDSFFIAAFSLVSAWRISSRAYVRGEGLRWWREYGIFLPFWLFAQLGDLIIRIVDSAMAIGVGSRVLDRTYDRLPQGINDFIFGALAVAAVLVTFLGVDVIYMWALHLR